MKEITIKKLAEKLNISIYTCDKMVKILDDAGFKDEEKDAILKCIWLSHDSNLEL